MKDLVTKAHNIQLKSSEATISALLLHICVAVLAFVASRGVILESYMPFGLVIVGGCTSTFLPSSAIGAFIGYFFPAVSTGGFKYIAALLAIIAVRLLLSGYGHLSENPFFLGGVALLSNVATGAVTYSGVPLDLLKLAAECIIIFGAVFVTHNTFESLSSSQSGLTLDETACLVCTAVIILIGLIRFSIFEISLGRTVGVFLLLASARYGGTAVSSACGIALSFACAVTASYESGFGIYALMGLAAGVFANLGKYAIAITSIATALIGVSLMQFKEDSGLFLTEIFLSAIAFLLIPRSLGINLSKFFYRHPTVNSQNGAENALSLRLNLASSALVDVADTVSQVSSELSKINAPDFKSVISLIEQDACCGCKLRLHCWENKSAATMDAVMQMINSVKGGDSSPDLNVLDEFQGRCIRINKMQETVKYRYSQYASMLSAEDRIDEVRQVVSEQFEGVSDMLNELSQSLTTDEHFNTHAAESAASALKNIGIHTYDCAAKIDKFGRMSLEMKIKYDNSTVFNRLQIMKILSLACERDFGIPNITKTGSHAVITVNERTNYKIDIGIEQHCAVAGSICGDAYKYFNDGKGNFVMILSDGMGTGGRAAVDSAMASGLMARLLKAGFGYDCSLKILNSSMLFKSSDESLATMDIACIDLFTGNTELYKAGAAPTIVKRNGHSGRAESHSLPVGILKDVSFDRAGIRLRQGDILLLVSDGVTFEGTEWIRRELEAWNDGSAQDLAEHICNSARRRYATSRPDDITVMAAILQKSE
ncbi:MAG: hypothetical protein E7521_03730 [Ruminococcaceae bacterium]|nr:hypothetical protein [Oscillospiraceae bacterium]